MGVAPLEPKSISFAQSGNKIIMEAYDGKLFTVLKNVMKKQAPRPQFIISPTQKDNRDLKTQMDLSDSKKRIPEHVKQQLRSTQFQFLIPAQGSDLDVSAALNDLKIPARFRQKMIDRFSGTAKHGFGLRSPQPLDTYYNDFSPRHDELNATTENMGGDSQIPNDTRDEGTAADTSIKESKNQPHLKVSDTSKAHRLNEGRQNKLLLGPTPYLALSSGFSSTSHSWERDTLSPRLTRAGFPQNEPPLGDGMDPKNVVKLDLQQRRKAGPKAKERTLKKPTTEKPEGGSMLREQSTLANLAQIDEHVSGEVLVTVQKQIDPHSITFGKKHSDESQLVTEVQGAASQINLNDVDTSPLNLHSPLDHHQNEIESPKRHPNSIGRKSPPTTSKLAQRFERNASPRKTKNQFKAAEVRKLSISLLDSPAEAPPSDFDNRQVVRSKLHASPSFQHQHTTFEQQQSFTRNMLTPHLQPNNLKYALQKEKSKRMINVINQSKAANDKKGFAHVQTINLDLGLNLSGEYQVMANKVGVAKDQQSKPAVQGQPDPRNYGNLTTVAKPLGSSVESGDASVKRPIGLSKATFRSAFHNLLPQSDDRDKICVDVDEKNEVNGWTSQYSKERKKRSDGFTKVGKSIDAASIGDLMASDRGGDSLVKIESDIKEMRNLIKRQTMGLLHHEGTLVEEDQTTLEAQPKEELVPLVNIRNSSKTALIKDEFSRDNKVKSTPKNKHFQVQPKGTTGVGSKDKGVLSKKAPTPLSILRESAPSEAGVQSLLRQSCRGSAVTLQNVSKQNSSAHPASLQHDSGPQLRSHWNKLPPLNFTQYMPHNFAVSPRQSNAVGPSQTVKHKGTPLAFIGDKRIANNFKVEIKKHLNQSVIVDSKANTKAIDEDMQFVDSKPWRTLYVSTERTNMREKAQAHLWVQGSHETMNLTTREPPKGGESIKGAVHLTLTQNLADQQTKGFFKRSTILPPKSLLYAQGKNKRAAAQASPKPANQSRNQLNQLEKERHRQIGLKGVSFQLGKIESGSVELTQSRRMRLASLISKDLLPLRIPTADRTKIVKNCKGSVTAERVRCHDASIGVKMGSITTEKVVKMMREDGALISQDSSVSNNGDRRASQVLENLSEWKFVSDEKPTRQSIKNQASEDSLILNKQVPDAFYSPPALPIRKIRYRRPSIEDRDDAESKGGISPLRNDVEWHIGFPLDGFKGRDVTIDGLLGDLHEKCHSEVIDSGDKDVDRALRVMARVDNAEPSSKEWLILKEQETGMQRMRQRETAEQNVSLVTPQSSVWVDDQSFARKNKPRLLMKDLEGFERRHGLIQRQSPFALSDFLRMDGKKLRKSQKDGESQ